MLIRDRKGRLWSGRLTCGSAIFLRDELSIDVMAWLADWDVATRDLSDPSIVANCVWGVLHKELRQRNITDTAFGKLLKGYTPEALVELIVDELRRFVHVPELLPGKPSKRSRSKVTSDALWGSVYQAAGIVGVDPSPYTLGELICMSDAKRKYNSAANALLACVTVNAQGGEAQPSDFDPTGFLKVAQDTADEALENIHELGKVLGITVKERKING